MVGDGRRVNFFGSIGGMVSQFGVIFYIFFAVVTTKDFWVADVWDK